eukprot:TRINITY_DN1527_c2_g1_i1.p1 TRINITY_DN1527_c2_g1~~TRINITY_DN1527_c2_g1_i1.p1  ORF type:complete len:252 (+),score=68.86 TRINITY_DN1527_c2_g1_i1:88-756(+)
MAEEERRLDPVDGNAYTKQEFVKQYGGETEWSVAAVAPAGEERRMDPVDGNRYTKKQFMQQYGGLTEWEAAGAAAGQGIEVPAPAAQAATAAPIPEAEPVDVPASTGRIGGPGGLNATAVDPQWGMEGWVGEGYELRICEDNGQCYNRDEFIEYYGGLDEWNVATQVPMGAHYDGNGIAVPRPCPGNWTCPGCGARNLQARQGCWKCNRPQPSQIAGMATPY